MTSDALKKCGKAWNINPLFGSNDAVRNVLSIKHHFKWLKRQLLQSTIYYPFNDLCCFQDYCKVVVSFLFLAKQNLTLLENKSLKISLKTQLTFTLL